MGKIIFCGSCIEKHLIYNLKEYSEAANKFQNILIQTLQVDNQVDVLSYITYKTDNMALFYDNENSYKYVVKQKNLFYTFKRYYNNLQKLCVNNDVIMFYNLSYINMFVNLFLKRYNVKSIVIIADHTSWREEKNILRKVISWINYNAYKKFDHIITLSSELNKELNSENSITLEGGIEFSKYEKFKINNNIECIDILYSGSIEKPSGIPILIDAIQKIDNKSVRFIFTGMGSLSKEVIELAKVDNRVINKGFVSEAELIKIQENSHILINPRDMNMSQNKNNFPSKILEYLATGRLIVSTKFSGYEKFDDYVNFCESNSAELAKAINNSIIEYENTKFIRFIENREFAKKYDWKIKVKEIENLYR